MPALTPRLIGYVTAAYVAGGLALFGHWALTGSFDLTQFYFRYIGAAFLIGAALVETVLCLSVHRGFGPGEAMGTAWLLLGMGGASRAVGYFSRHLLAYHPGIAGLSPDDAKLLDDFGRDLAGPLAMTIQAVALWIALRVHAKLGLESSFTPADWILLGAVSAFGLSQVVQLPGWIAEAASPPSLQWLIGWSMYPLLSILLAAAIALRRRIGPLRPGLFAQCWGSYTAGILLTALGIALNELIAREIIRWPWDAGFWLVWYPAAAAYACAPLYQRMAMRRLECWELDESALGDTRRRD